MTLMSRGAAALVRRKKQADGVAVTYTRGATVVTLTVWVGRTAFSRLGTEPGPALVWGDRDYLVAAADLVAAGLTEPRKGDRVTEAGAGTFEVVPPDTGEPAFRFSDQTRLVYRLHVKRAT